MGGVAINAAPPMFIFSNIPANSFKKLNSSHKS